MRLKKRCAVLSFLTLTVILWILLSKEAWSHSSKKRTTFQKHSSWLGPKEAWSHFSKKRTAFQNHSSWLGPKEAWSHSSEKRTAFQKHSSWLGPKGSNTSRKLEEDQKINVAFMLDQGLLFAVPTSINSIWNNTKRAVRIFILVTKGNGSDEFPSEYLSCFFGNLTEKDIHVKSVNGSQYIDPEVYGHMNRRKKRENTSKEGNYIRLYLHRLLPKYVNRVIYLDVDVLVLDDIGKLWDLCANHTGILSGVFFEKAYTRRVRSDGHTNLTSAAYGLQRLGMKLNETFRVINTGMVVINMAKLRSKEHEIMKKLLVWAVGDTKFRWFFYDTQFLISFVFYGEITGIPVRWNIGSIDDYLGFPRFLSYKNPGILHYYGTAKPWLRKSYLHHVWDRYKVQMCSGHGKCVGNNSMQRESPYCQCKQDYSGDICQKKMTKVTQYIKS